MAHGDLSCDTSVALSDSRSVWMECPGMLATPQQASLIAHRLDGSFPVANLSEPTLPMPEGCSKARSSERSSFSGARQRAHGQWAEEHSPQSGFTLAVVKLSPCDLGMVSKQISTIS